MYVSTWQFTGLVGLVIETERSQGNGNGSRIGNSDIKVRSETNIFIEEV